MIDRVNVRLNKEKKEEENKQITNTNDEEQATQQRGTGKDTGSGSEQTNGNDTNMGRELQTAKDQGKQGDANVPTTSKEGTSKGANENVLNKMYQTLMLMDTATMTQVARMMDGIVSSTTEMVGGGTTLRVEAPAINNFSETIVDVDFSDIRQRFTKGISDSDVTYLGEISLDKTFEFVAKPVSYVQYKGESTILGSKQFNLMSRSDHIMLSDTMDTFSIGNAFTQLAMNYDYFRPYNLTTEVKDLTNTVVKKEIPFTALDLVQRGEIFIETSQNKYILGVLGLIYVVSMDNEILVRVQADYTGTVALPPQISRFTMNKVQLDVGPNPALLTALYDYPKWLTSNIEEQITLKDASGIKDYIYKLGRTDVQQSNMYGTNFLATYAMNIDNFKAQILSYNLTHLLANRVKSEQITEHMLKCSLPGTLIETVPEGVHRLETRESTAVMERAMMLSMILDDEVNEKIFDLNKAILRSYGIINIRTMPVLYDKQSNSNQATILDFRNVITRITSVADLTMVESVIAQEMTPNLTIFNFRDTEDVGASDDQGLIYIWLLYLNVLFRPNAFDGVKHMVQEKLLQIFASWIPKEFVKFTEKYGEVYEWVTIDKVQRRVFIKGAPKLTMSDYLENRHASLFAGIEFTNCPLITQVMSFLQPAGELVNDDLPKSLQFPRFSKTPQHYIPYKPEQNGTIRLKVARYNLFIELMLKLVSTTSRRPGSVLEAIRSWFRWTVQPMTAVFEGYNYIHAVYRVMQNFPHNVMSTFNGDYATYKPTNYVLKGQDSQRELIRRRGDSHAYLSEYRLSDVLAIFGQMITPNMNESGNGTVKIGINKLVPPPNPQEMLLESNSLITKCVQVASAFGIVAYVTSDELKKNFPEIGYMYDLLSNLGNTQLRELVDYLGTLKDIDTGALGKIKIDRIGDMFQRIGFGDAQIFRSKFGTLIPYDEDIDPPSFANVNFFMSKLQQRRMAVGVKLVTNQRLRDLHKGLRFTNEQQYQYDFNQIPPVDGYTEFKYVYGVSDVTLNINGSNQSGLRIKGVEYMRVGDLPTKIHCILEDTVVMSKPARLFIKAAVNMRDWIVSVPNAIYTVLLTSDLRIKSTISLESVLTSTKGTIFTLVLYDTASWLHEDPGMLPPNYISFQTVFPMHEVSASISVRGIVNDPGTKNNMQVWPTREEMDTGAVALDGTILYTNGGTKFNNPFEVSMTNKVYAFTSSVTNDTKFQYTFTPPSLYPFKL